MPDTKKKIAILGGGIAGLSTAFNLTREKDWRERYDITVYEQSWRLGGKGASGRSRNPEQGWESRIEEHGLHVLLGFYAETFRLLEECYAALRELPPERVLEEMDGAQEKPDMERVKEVLRHRFGRWDQWLEGRDEIHFLEPRSSEDSSIWTVMMPNMSGRVPWTPRKGWVGWGRKASSLFGFLGDPDEVQSDAEFLVEQLLKMTFPEDKARRIFEGLRGPDVGAESRLEEIREAILGSVGLKSALAPDLQTLNTASQAVRSQKLVRLSMLQELSDRREEDWNANGPPKSLSDEQRRAAILRNLGFTIILGLSEQGFSLQSEDLEALDDKDFREWLTDQGAQPEAVESVIVQAGYNLTFSGAKGLAAGAAIQGLNRMLRYPERLYYKMKVGMGEVVFAPLYLVLKSRGVRFEFFEEAKALHLSEDKRDIDAIDMHRRWAAGDGGYRPLSEVDGLPCWPTAPFLEQLREVEETRVLRRGVDFDEVVLGIPVGALPPLCAELLPYHPRLAEMLRYSATTATHSAQVWFTRKLEEPAQTKPGVGWRREGGIVATCPAPFDTWADCTQVLASEKWVGEPPRSVVYLCGPLDDEAPPKEPVLRSISPVPDEQVREDANTWCGTMLPRLWPEVVLQVSGRLSRTGLPAGARSMHCQANTEPWERYVLTPPGSTASRLDARVPGMDNLVLAGDWVRTPLNTGCIEAACLSGRLAAHALSPFEVSRNSLPDLPSYIEREGVANWSGPFRQGDTLLTSFFLHANQETLQAVVDTYLNGPLKTERYRPLAGFVIVQCARINESRSENALYKDRGFLREREIGISIPVVRGRMTLEGFRADRFLLFMPYIFVDTGVSLIVGREAFGFAKQLAKVEIPEEVEKPALFRVETLVVPEAEAQAREEELLRIWRGPSSTAPQPLSSNPDPVDESQIRRGGPAVAVFTELFDAVLEQVGDTNWSGWSELGAFSQPGLVFLKQFRDAVQPTRACYQALVETDIGFSAVRDGWILPAEEFEVVFKAFDTHPIARELGLKQDGPLRPFVVSVMKLDFTLGRSTTISGED